MAIASQTIVYGFSNIEIAKQIWFGETVFTGLSRAGQTISVYHGDTLIADCIMPSTGSEQLPTVLVGTPTVHDETFSGFVDGETYTIVAGDESPITGFVANGGLASFDVGSLLAVAGVSGEGWTGLDGAENHHDFSVSQKVQTTRKKYDIKLLPEELLPKTVAKKADVLKAQKLANDAQSTANSAQSVAENAQSTANRAQTAANNAQSTANRAQTAANNAQSTANRAQTAANNAQSTANSAQSVAENAQSTANNAKTAAEAAATKRDPEFSGSFSQNRMAGSTIGACSHAEGYNTTASGNRSHAEGTAATASGESSHAEGASARATEAYAHAEGYDTTASGTASHAEGNTTTAGGAYAHAEGGSTKASGDRSHAEGSIATASGESSHAEGVGTTASGNQSHAEGVGTTAQGHQQHAQGRFNISNYDHAHIVGNGKSDAKRSNAHTLDWSGNAWFAGDVYVGSTSGTDKDDGSKKLATEDYVDSKIPSDSGSAVQPDWSQNDETAADYVKNRPGGYSKFEDGTPVTRTLNYTEEANGGFVATDQGTSLKVKAGSPVISRVTYDGVDYIVDRNSTQPQSACIGDAALEKYPFALGCEEYVGGGSYTYYDVVKTAGEHTITVTPMIEVPVKIPEKYMSPIAQEVYPLSKSVSITRFYSSSYDDAEGKTHPWLSIDSYDSPPRICTNSERGWYFHELPLCVTDATPTFETDLAAGEFFTGIVFRIENTKYELDYYGVVLTGISTSDAASSQPALVVRRITKLQRS